MTAIITKEAKKTLINMERTMMAGYYNKNEELYKNEYKKTIERYAAAYGVSFKEAEQKYITDPLVANREKRIEEYKKYGSK